MNARVVARVTIAADAATVFNYLTDLETHYLWNPHLQRIAPLINLYEGATYQTTSLLLGVKVESHIAVTRVAANKCLELKSETGSLHYRVIYQLSQEAARTVVICSTTVSSDSKAFALTKPMLKLLAHRELQADLHAFKHVVEKRLT